MQRPRKLPRAPRVMGVPIRPKTGIDLMKAGRDIAMRKFVPDDIRNERLSICQGCEHWSKQSNRCTECGCQMRVKSSLSSSKCPINKWGPYIAKHE
jgi:hypothetical protein